MNSAGKIQVSIRLIWACCLVAFIALSCKQKANPSPNASQLTGYFPFRKLSEKEKNKYANDAAVVYDKILAPNHFNGGIIVAKNGEIVFERYAGMANFSTNEPINAYTSFHIASISKTFTSAVILRLYQQRKLLLTDSIQQYLPQFPYHNITLQCLLSHRSGLPKYEYFLDTAWHETRKATNEDVLKYMITHKPDAYALPNKRYHYCNTNYALLALIIEKVTQMPFPKYLKDSLFTPLGMKNSFVFNITDTANYQPSFTYNNTPYKLDPLDCIYGDKNIYSTPRDLLIWDKALYQGSFVTKETLQLAFTGYSNERKSLHNYGLGWHLFMNGGDKVIYHNGWWHGNNTVFNRMIKDTATVITLSNRYNRSVYWSARIGYIFSAASITDDWEE